MSTTPARFYGKDAVLHAEELSAILTTLLTKKREHQQLELEALHLQERLMQIALTSTNQRRVWDACWRAQSAAQRVKRRQQKLAIIDQLVTEVLEQWRIVAIRIREGAAARIELLQRTPASIAWTTLLRSVMSPVSLHSLPEEPPTPARDQ